MIANVIQRYPIRSAIIVWGLLLAVVWMMPGDPRPEDILAKAIGLNAQAASKGPCHQ